jgi:hypothetical protein
VKGHALFSALLRQTDTRKRLVQFNVQLHSGAELAHHERLEALIGLKQSLRDLCVAAGMWDPEMEQSHEADLAALRKLAHPGWKDLEGDHARDLS